jgi:4-hydroxy-tetrahydrodipicolinate reductase
MKLLILGRGKTGTLVAEVARERGHQVEVLGAAENFNSGALTPERLQKADMVIDFTTPAAVLLNIEKCMEAKARMVVGTTGWSEHLSRVRDLVQASGGALLWASNFSVGMNIFLDALRAAAAALRHGYAGNILERHHAEKKDAPSGTAVSIQRVMEEASGVSLEITSLREGDVVGQHVIVLDSLHDTMMFTHDAKSRRSFAEGAVLAAEWLKGRTGFYEFRDVLHSGLET